MWCSATPPPRRRAGPRPTAAAEPEAGPRRGSATTPTTGPATPCRGPAGDFFARNADTSPHNAHPERPAPLALAGDLGDARVLGVGCEAGRLAEEFAARGARVLGIDGNATLVDHARAPLADRVELPVVDGAFSIRCQRMSPDALLTGVLAVGLVVDRLVEPRPVDEPHRIDADTRRRLSQVPDLLVPRLLSPLRRRLTAPAPPSPRCARPPR